MWHWRRNLKPSARFQAEPGPGHQRWLPRLRLVADPWEPQAQGQFIDGSADRQRYAENSILL